MNVKTASDRRREWLDNAPGDVRTHFQAKEKRLEAQAKTIADLREGLASIRETLGSKLQRVIVNCQKHNALTDMVAFYADEAQLLLKLIGGEE